MRKRLLATVSAGTLTATAFLGVALATPALAEGGCSPSVQQTTAGTFRATQLYGRTIELRGNNGATCVWGRISNGSQGDSVWMNRSDIGDMTNYPYGGAGKAFIQAGVDQAYVKEAYNDVGLQAWACGKAVDRATVFCTGKY